MGKAFSTDVKIFPASDFPHLTGKPSLSFDC
jgi:hypothetical protein